MNKHDTLLLACRLAPNRKYLSNIFGSRYHLLEADNVQQALMLLRQNMDCIAALMLNFPEEQLNELVQSPDYSQDLKRVPVIVMTHEERPEMIHRIFEAGAADVIPMTYEPFAMLRRVETIVDLHLHKQYLEHMVQEQANALRQSNETLIDALSSIIEYRGTESSQHIFRIRHYVKLLLEEVARCCPEYHLDDRAISVISSASALHDIGMVAVPDHLISKAQQLTPDEKKRLYSHTQIGCQMLQSIRGAVEKDYLQYAREISLYHHERWDGTGAPNGLCGEDIPISAQVTGLADIYDHLTSKEPKYSPVQAANGIFRGDWGGFSPKLLECFKHVTETFAHIAVTYADGNEVINETLEQTLPPPIAEAENSLERVRGKYNALVHYIDSLLLEVDLRLDLFHLIYNPYPDISWCQQADSFSELSKLLDTSLLAPDETFSHLIRSFMEQNQRRITHQFHEANHLDSLLEVTLLRITPVDSKKKTLAILIRRLTQESLSTAPKITSKFVSDSNLLCRYDETFTLIQLGERLPQLLGYTREELSERFHDRLSELIVPEDLPQLYQAFREQFLHGKIAKTQYRMRRKDGSLIWILDKSRLFTDTDGQEYLNSMLTDITDIKRDYDTLHNKLRSYEIVLSQTENALFEWDLQTDSITFSDTCEKLFGFHPYAKDVQTLLKNGSYFHPDDFPRLTDGITRLKNHSSYEIIETRIATTHGYYVWFRIRASAVHDNEGNPEKICGVIINIDAEKREETKLQMLAQRDGLTKLLNKQSAREQAEEYLAQFPEGTPCALLIIDLDNFKQVNDRYGHMFGDTILTKTAAEIANLFREKDIVARIGGDEFMVLMRGTNDRTLLETRCTRLLNIFSTLFQNNAQKLPLGCSIGIAIAPEHGTSYYELFNKADQALYQVKDHGKNSFAFYDPKKSAFSTQSVGHSAVNNTIDSEENPDFTPDNLTQSVFHQLYTSQDVEHSIQDILAIIGKRLNVSRVYVFENTDDNRFCKNTYEWCNEGISSVIDMLQHVSYETDIPDYLNNFDEQGIFYCPDVQVLPKCTYELAKAQNVKSMLQCAFREKDVIRGYIGFDECVEQRMWTKSNIQHLRYFSEMLSLFLLKHREHQKALSVSKQMNLILDNQNAWIYIIDPATCVLKYVNAKTRALSPDIQPGMHCYEAIMGKSERCANCPALHIEEKKTNYAVMVNEKYHKKVLADATWYSADNDSCCMVTCREWIEHE